MSKADEMFKKLGLKLIFEKRDLVRYAEGWVQKEIYFDNIDKSITLYDFNTIKEEAVLGFSYLVAINEKIKELGWLDEE